MKKNIIAVCDTDTEYACNFAEYINSRKKLPFQAEVFTDVEKLCSYAGKTPPEILLIAEENVDYKVKDIKTDNMILLSEEKEKSEGEEKCVYKYQSADSVIQEVMAYYAQNAEPVTWAAGGRRLSVLGVYSPVGRCGKTLFALTAGQILGENKSVLYLNMEDYSGFNQLFRQEYEKNLSDFFYELRCKKTDFLQEPEGMIQHMGKMDYISPAASAEDIRDIRFSEWMQLIEWIRTGSRYEVLILDMGNSVDQVFRILNLCSRIYMPVLEDRMSLAKIRQFKSLISDWEIMGEDKIKELHLPVFCPESADTDFLEMLTWGKWGAYVRKVLEEAYGHGTKGKK